MSMVYKLLVLYILLHRVQKTNWVWYTCVYMHVENGTVMAKMKDVTVFYKQ